MWSSAPPALVPEQSCPALLTGAPVVATRVVSTSVAAAPSTRTVTVGAASAGAELMRPAIRPVHRPSFMLDATPFHEGVWRCGRREVSWLPAYPPRLPERAFSGRRRSPGGSRRWKFLA